MAKLTVTNREYWEKTKRIRRVNLLEQFGIDRKTGNAMHERSWDELPAEIRNRGGETCPLELNVPQFSDIFGKYKHYDTSGGFGTLDDVRRAFNQTMGKEEAVKQLHGRPALAILGFDHMPTLDELKRQYRKLMLQYHPDVEGGDPEKAKDVIAAYSEIEREINPA